MIEIEMEESSLDRHLQDSRCRCRINCAPHKRTAAFLLLFRGD
uniref:Uncharacterized protein n=1 Tax=Arundo donax TaxID=35708 RepID=A0A0A9D1P9_ARUDO